MLDEAKNVRCTPKGLSGADTVMHQESDPLLMVKL